MKVRTLLIKLHRILKYLQHNTVEAARVALAKTRNLVQSQVRLTAIAVNRT